MSTLAVLDAKGKKSGEVELADELLVLDRGRQTVQDAVVAYRANQRAGTASTKTKAEVAGSGKKLWKQKGTGRARTGYRRSPIWRGGGVAFGPRPRDFHKKLTKKAGRLAFARAISESIQDGSLVVVEDVVMTEPKTKTLWQQLQAFGVEKNGVLVVDEVDRSLALSARNLPKVEVVAARDLNTYQVLRYSRVVVTRKGLAALQARMEKARGTGRAS